MFHARAGGGDQLRAQLSGSVPHLRQLDGEPREAGAVTVATLRSSVSSFAASRLLWALVGGSTNRLISGSRWVREKATR